VPGLTGQEVPVGWIAEGLLVMRLGDPAPPLGEIYRIDLNTGRQSVPLATADGHWQHAPYGRL
jgi:hypothetical protein